MKVLRRTEGIATQAVSNHEVVANVHAVHGRSPWRSHHAVEYRIR